MTALQWGGRFSAEPDRRLLDFGSSLQADRVLAAFDVECSRAHVEALRGGGIVDAVQAETLFAALAAVAAEIAGGEFVGYANECGFEDVHGAIDARVRAIAGATGEWLHAGRSRNDQVATTLLLYVRDRAAKLSQHSREIAGALLSSARDELEQQTLLAGCTHRQPAQPVLLAFVLAAWCEPFVRAVKRLDSVGAAAAQTCPLGSAALAGSTLPLDSLRAAQALGFAAPARNALDAIGNRDAALDLAHAAVRAVIDASRIAEELIAWSAPAYGYVRLGDTASTGSSLMPQKRNPDPFELVRAHAGKLVGMYAGALTTLCGLATSYQRDLQETKSLVLAIVEDTLAVLQAFAGAWRAVRFDRERMNAGALDGYTLATDIADALIARGVSARSAHALVGAAVATAESEQRELEARDLARLAQQAGLPSLEAPLDARASVDAKCTSGSTAPAEVARAISSLEAELA